MSSTDATSVAAHIRIDEGVKRGPKGRLRRPIRKDPETGLPAGMPKDIDPDKILQQYLVADTTSQISRDLGVRRSTLSRWLRDTVPEKWKAVQIVRADMRKEDGDCGIYNAGDALELARARELLRSAQWDLERLDSANYGPKQEVTVNAQPILNITIVAPAQPKLINEVETGALQQPDKPIP